MGDPSRVGSGCPPVRVLVVDDNWDVRFLMERALGRLGVEVQSVDGGPPALALLDDETAPDLVILDVQMPEMDGWEVLEKIRGNDAIADVPVILCTVKGRPADAVHAWELGCDGYVTKPFEIDQLVDELCRVLSQTSTERARVRVRCLEQAREQLRLLAQTETPVDG